MDNDTEKIPLLIEIQCFGNVLFWAELINSRQVIFEQHEHFQKSGYRNRYHVLGANGVITLTIPVVGGRETRELTRQVKIDNSHPWQKSQWRTLESCYNKSPFFFHYAPGLQLFFQKEYERLWDFNADVFEWVKKQIKVPLQIDYTEAYHQPGGYPSLLDWRGKFKTSNRNDFCNTHYYQVFDAGFQQNLSILDILFNLGPETSSYLIKQSTI